MSRKPLRRTGPCLLVMLALCVCGDCSLCESGREEYIIEDGYVGPIVVVFGDPGGEEVVTDALGTTVYRIGPKGVLSVTSGKRKGFVRRTCSYKKTNGDIAIIPYEVDADK